MAPSVADAPRRLSRSFRDVLDGGAGPAREVGYLVGDMEGVPALFISDSDSLALAKPFELTLIGKFAAPCPPLSVLRSFASRMKFSGGVRVHRHDNLNAIFCFSVEQDYTRFFSHRFYTVFGMLMKVVKWSPFTDVSTELPIVPLWLSFPGLRFQYFDKRTLLFVGGLFGKPLGVDAAAVSLGNLAHARVLVEIDVSKPIPNKVWIGSRLSGYYQTVVVENQPPFCGRCSVVGHSSLSCSGRSPPSVSVPQGSDGLAASPRSPIQDLAVVCYHPHEITVSGPGRGSPQGGGGVLSTLGDVDGDLSMSGDPLIDGGVVSNCFPSGGLGVLAPSLEGVPSVAGSAQEGPDASVGPIPVALAREVVLDSNSSDLVVGEAVTGVGGQFGGPEAVLQSVLPAGQEMGCANVEVVPVIGWASDAPCGFDPEGAGSPPPSPFGPGFPTRGITTRSMSKGGPSQPARRGGEGSGKNKKKNKRKTKYDAAMAIALHALFKPPDYDK